MDLGSLFQQVSGMLNNNTRQNENVDTDGLIGQVAGLFRGHAEQTGNQFPEQYNQGPYDNVLPASQDPLGDPADQGGQQGYQQVQYGGQSAADQQAGILPASQDPLGDPADQR